MLSYKYLFTYLLQNNSTNLNGFLYFIRRHFLYSLSKTTTPSFAMLDFLISDTLHYFYFYLTACESEIFNKDYFAFITIIKFKGTGSYIIFSHFSVLNNIRMNISVKKNNLYLLSILKLFSDFMFADNEAHLSLHQWIKKSNIFFKKAPIFVLCFCLFLSVRNYIIWSYRD